MEHSQRWVGLELLSLPEVSRVSVSGSDFYATVWISEPAKGSSPCNVEGLGMLHSDDSTKSEKSLKRQEEGLMACASERGTQRWCVPSFCNMPRVAQEEPTTDVVTSGERENPKESFVSSFRGIETFLFFSYYSPLYSIPVYICR